MKSGYNAALTLAYEKLVALPPETVCERCGVRFEQGEYYLPWFSKEQPLSQASTAHKIIWLHYLTSQGTKKPSGRLMPYRDAPGALFYDSNFTKRAVNPFIKRFGNDPEGLIRAGEALGGHKGKNGDASVVLNALPYIPLTFIIWLGDEEFGPGGSILFDETVKTWLCAEDLAVLGSLCAYELIGYKVQDTSYK